MFAISQVYLSRQILGKGVEAYHKNINIILLKYLVKASVTDEFKKKERVASFGKQARCKLQIF